MDVYSVFYHQIQHIKRKITYGFVLISRNDGNMFKQQQSSAKIRINIPQYIGISLDNKYIGIRINIPQYIG